MCLFIDYDPIIDLVALEKFILYCRHQRINDAQKLLNDMSNEKFIDIHYNNDVIFRSACEKGHIKTAKWLLSLEPKYGKIDIHYDDDNVLLCSASKNRLTVVKWLLSLESTHGKFNIHTKMDCIFTYTCKKGYFNMAKLMESLKDTHGKFNIKHDLSFYDVCTNGDMKMVKWLLSLEPEYGQFNIHPFDSEELFSTLCYKGYLEIAKLLVSLESTHGKINIHTCYLDDEDSIGDEYAFSTACENGNYEFAKWLISLQPTHGKIQYRDDETFLYACNTNNIEHATILSMVNSRYILSATEDTILSYYIINVKTIYNNPSTYSKYFIYEKVDNKCIICYDDNFDTLIKLCKTTDNDHYYCINCIEFMKNDERCLLCKEEPHIRIYKDGNPNKTVKRRKIK